MYEDVILVVITITIISDIMDALIVFTYCFNFTLQKWQIKLQRRKQSTCRTFELSNDLKSKVLLTHHYLHFIQKFREKNHIMKLSFREISEIL